MTAPACITLLLAVALLLPCGCSDERETASVNGGGDGNPFEHLDPNPFDGVAPQPAHSPPPVVAGAFTGTFTGDLLGTPATLELSASGAQLSGALSFPNGILLPLAGTIDGSTARGNVQDPDGAGAFEATIRGDDLAWSMTVKLPDRPIERYDFSFQRGAAPSPIDAGSERDPALFGHWRHTDTEMGPMDTWFILNPDGTFRLGDYRVPDEPLNTSETLTGRWLTSGSIIHLLADGTSQWQPLARYYTERDALLLTYADGSKVVWHQR